MIEAIIKTQAIYLWKMCDLFPSTAKTLRINRRLQRFVSEVGFNPMHFDKIIVRLNGIRDLVFLIVDRRNWKLGDSNINIQMLSLR